MTYTAYTLTFEGHVTTGALIVKGLTRREAWTLAQRELKAWGVDEINKELTENDLVPIDLYKREVITLYSGDM